MHILPQKHLDHSSLTRPHSMHRHGCDSYASPHVHRPSHCLFHCINAMLTAASAGDNGPLLDHQPLLTAASLAAASVCSVPCRDCSTFVIESDAACASACALV